MTRKSDRREQETEENGWIDKNDEGEERERKVKDSCYEL